MPEDISNAGNPDPSPQSSSERRSGKKRRRWLWWASLLVVLAVIGILLFLRFHASRTRPAAAPPALPVSTVAARKGDLEIHVNALGSVTPVNTVTITSQVNGQLRRVAYAEGQMVRAGELLAEIDPSPFEAQLLAAQGQYERDQALLAAARVDLERYQAAYVNKAIPKQLLDDQLHTVQQDEGTVKFDLGQVQNAKVQLAYCRIASPISGRVGLRLVDPGNIVLASSSNALLVVTQLQPMTVIFSVAEDYLPRIQQQFGQGNPMIVDAYDRLQQKKIATGKLLTLDNLIDAATGTLRLKAIFTNEDLALFPNQFVNARLLIETLRGVTLVPSAAIQRSSTGAFVYVINDGQTAAMRPITVAAEEGGESAVQGVQPGEIIATDNFNRLQDKARVVMRQAQNGANPKAGP